MGKFLSKQAKPDTTIAHQTFLANTASIAADSKYTDLKIICENKEFPVHRAIVCPQSDVLAKEVEEYYERAEGTIVLESIDAVNLERMIQFIYTGDYDPSELDWEEELETEEAIRQCREHSLIHIQMHAIGSQFNLAALKTKAVEKFDSALLAIRYYLLVERREDPVWYDILSLIEAVCSQPESEDAGLRSAMTDRLFDVCDGMLQNKAFVGGIEDGNAAYAEMSMLLLRKCQEEYHAYSRRYGAHYDDTEKKRLALKTELVNAKADAKKHKKMYQSIKDDLESAAVRVDDQQSCKKCQSIVSGRVEWSDEGKMFVVCRECMAKHTLRPWAVMEDGEVASNIE